jgi:hypothetical protein
MLFWIKEATNRGISKAKKLTSQDIKLKKIEGQLLLE